MGSVMEGPWIVGELQFGFKHEADYIPIFHEDFRKGLHIRVYVQHESGIEEAKAVAQLIKSAPGRKADE